MKLQKCRLVDQVKSFIAVAVAVLMIYMFVLVRLCSDGFFVGLRTKVIEGSHYWRKINEKARTGRRYPSGMISY